MSNNEPKLNTETTLAKREQMNFFAVDTFDAETLSLFKTDRQQVPVLDKDGNEVLNADGTPVLKTVVESIVVKTRAELAKERKLNSRKDSDVLDELEQQSGEKFMVFIEHMLVELKANSGAFMGKGARAKLAKDGTINWSIRAKQVGEKQMVSEKAALVKLADKYSKAFNRKVSLEEMQAIVDKQMEELAQKEAELKDKTLDVPATTTDTPAEQQQPEEKTEAELLAELEAEEKSLVEAGN